MIADVMQLVDKVSSLEETMLQLKQNNAESIKLVKAQCNANYTIRDQPSRVFMFDDQIVRDIHKVATAGNETVALHKASRATSKY